ncbi:MAG TPA: GNAT family N-acetyltransferase [Anaerolineaceae bacterium]|nr:GNAT family N-acetyltransferase [Anaerolineaceae bacterium]
MIVEYPLTKANRIRLGSAFRDVPRVDLTIDCVLEGQMGRVYVDDLARPQVHQIQTAPFVYFAGDPASPAAQEFFLNLSPFALLMPSAPGWIEAVQTAYGERLESFDRYSMNSAGLSADHLAALARSTPYGEWVRPMDRALVESLWGKEHFVDLSEYDSADDFLERGVGFYVPAGTTVAGAAFASLVCSRGIEISIYVQDKYRRQGMATALAANLLLWCLERRLEPHWDAANPESCSLALKLGYKFAGNYQAYYLVE